MAKSFRQKNVSKKLKRKIRGGDEKSDAAKTIQRLFRKGQSKKKTKSATKIQNLVRQVQSKKKKNKSAKKIQSIARSFSARNSIKKKHPDFKKKLNDAVNIVKSRQCGICYDSIKPSEKFEECSNKHIFHTDCLSKWCSAAAGERQVSPENPNILQTPCPTCRVWMNCPGSRDDIESIRKQNRSQYYDELFQEFQQQQQATQNRRRTQRAAPPAEQPVLEAITAAEAHIMHHIVPNMPDYRELSKPSCLRNIESEIVSYVDSLHLIDLYAYRDNNRIIRALESAKYRILNAIGEYCVENILIPRMQDRLNTLTQDQTIEEIIKRVSNRESDSSLDEAFKIHHNLQIFSVDISRGVVKWWDILNQERLEYILRHFNDQFGEFVVLSDGIRYGVENVRPIGNFNFGNVDNMYLCNFFGIDQHFVEEQMDADDFIYNYERQFNRNRDFRNYQSLFDEDGELQLYNALGGTDAEHQEIIGKIGTRKIRSNVDDEYPSHIDMNDDLGVNVYIGTNRSDEDHIIDRIWAIYGPGGVYSANNGRALLRSREVVNTPRSRTGSRSDTIYNSSRTQPEAEAEENN